MKTILVPTDFSITASNAIDYAIEMAKILNAKIILFHVYSMPVIPSEVPIILSVNEIEKNAIEGLEKIEKVINATHGKNLRIECICKYGFPVDEINNYVVENNMDLIVMGIEGAGFLMEKLVGSNTTSLIKTSKCPLLVIDKQVKFKNLNKIVFASDFTQINNQSVFRALKELIQFFKSHLYIVNVTSDAKKEPTVDNALAGVKLEHAIEDVNHTFHFVKNKDVVDGINQFVKENRIDMVVMIPHEHSLFESIFNESETKHLAFHTTVPLFVLHV